jgi:urease beta subunit
MAYKIKNGGGGAVEMMEGYHRDAGLMEIVGRREIRGANNFQQNRYIVT